MTRKRHSRTPWNSGLAFAALLPGVIAGQPANAQTFDNNYLTDWIGNTWGFGDNRHVQNNLEYMWVKPDGTVYTGAGWDEGHFAGGIYKNGDQFGTLQDTFQDFAGIRWLTGDNNYIYAARGNAIRRYHFDGSHAGGYPGSGGNYGDDFVPKGTSDHIGTGPVAANASASRLYAIVDSYNSGGGYVGSQVQVFDTTNGLSLVASWAIPGRNQAMTVGPDGSVWIALYNDGSNNGAVVHYSAGGSPLSPTITGGTTNPQFNPTSLCFDPSGRLLIADNGPWQDVLIFDQSGSYQSEFGSRGGILSGTPGQPAPLKFNGLTGVGVDSSGNIYVGQNRFGPVATGYAEGGSILESYQAGGTRNWQLLGLEFIDCADFDASSDSGNVIDAYSKFVHYRIDFSKPNGHQWSYLGETLNRFKYPGDPRATKVNDNGNGTPDPTAHAFVRTIRGQKFLFMGTMTSNFLEVYRFNPSTDGEIAIPCGQVYGDGVWRDLNGNGQRDGGEDTAGPGIPGPLWVNYYVDASGDIWETNDGSGVTNIRHFVCQGLDANGSPIWDYASGHFSVESGPAPFSELYRAHYIPGADTMVLTGYAPSVDSAHGYNKDHYGIKWIGSVLAAYKNWSGGNRTAAWSIVLPDYDGGPVSLAQAGDYIFVGYAHFGDDSNSGRIRVFRLSDGSYVGTAHAGPEVGNVDGTMDIAYGLNAIKRANGEYDIFAEDDYHAKVLLYRWTEGKEQPYTTPAVIPGTVQAEDYDLGGEGVAYHLTSGTGGQVAYRSDNNGDVHPGSGPNGGGYAVGWSNTGAWYKYAVNVQTSGTYTVAFQTASAGAGGTFHLEDEKGNNLTGTLTAPNTGAWGIWQTVSATVSLTAGAHTLRLVEDANGPNPWVADFDFLQFTLQQAQASALFSTGFESGDPQPTWNDSPDAAYNNSPASVSGYLSGISPECSERNETANSGSTALMYSGTAGGGGAYCYFRVFDLSANPLTLTSATQLAYWIYPQQDNGRYVAVDLHCTDGTTLRDSGAVDQNGFSVHPNAGHGGQIPLNAWSRIQSNIGAKLAGKTVDKIWVAFDRPGATGQFRGYLDDISIGEGAPTSLTAL